MPADHSTAHHPSLWLHPGCISGESCEVQNGRSHCNCLRDRRWATWWFRSWAFGEGISFGIWEFIESSVNLQFMQISPWSNQIWGIEGHHVQNHSEWCGESIFRNWCQQTNGSSLAQTQVKVTAFWFEWGNSSQSRETSCELFWVPLMIQWFER